MNKLQSNFVYDACSGLSNRQIFPPRSFKKGSGTSKRFITASNKQQQRSICCLRHTPEHRGMQEETSALCIFNAKLCCRHRRHSAHVDMRGPFPKPVNYAARFRWLFLPALLNLTASKTQYRNVLQLLLGIDTTAHPRLTRPAAFSSVRLKTDNGYPALSKRAAIGEPINPRPIKPSEVFMRMLHVKI